jgi:hypothetical protein
VCFIRYILYLGHVRVCRLRFTRAVVLRLLLSARGRFSFVRGLERRLALAFWLGR